MPYEVSKQTDKHGNAFWYCHRKGFLNVPVFGSIGSYQKAKSVCDMYNESVGAKEPKRKDDVETFKRRVKAVASPTPSSKNPHDKSKNQRMDK